VLRQQRRELGQIRAHHFCHLFSVLEEFERGHGLDFLIGSYVFGLVDIHFGKDDAIVFGLLGKLFEFGSDELTGTACLCVEELNRRIREMRGFA